MCCFSGSGASSVQAVANTRIFARNSGLTHQFLVYEMTYQAKDDLAMILPIPVLAPARDDSVRFINLQDYPKFFNDMNSGFPVPRAAFTGAGGGGGGGGGGIGVEPRPVINVEKVGAFEASFVPTVNDFDRLDERFRLPSQTWEQLPKYQSYGFAVFKLKKDANSTHPMAFEFPRANQAQLFFPTVHIHDGQVHEKAMFDHTLYAQFPLAIFNGFEKWTESTQPGGMFMDLKKSKGIIDEFSHAYKLTIVGKRKNEDILA